MDLRVSGLGDFFKLQLSFLHSFSAITLGVTSRHVAAFGAVILPAPGAQKPTFPRSVFPQLSTADLNIFLRTFRVSSDGSIIFASVVKHI